MVLVEWLYSQDVLGTVGWIGTIVGLAGLALTYREASAARRSANAAATAVIAYNQKENLANIGLVYSLIGNVQALTQQAQYVAAREVYKNVSWIMMDIAQAHLRAEGKPSDLEWVSKNVRITTTQLDRACAGDERFNAEKLTQNLYGSLQYVMSRKANLLLGERK